MTNRKGYHDLRGLRQKLLKFFVGFRQGSRFAHFVYIAFSNAQKNGNFWHISQNNEITTLHETSSRVRSKGVVLLP